jgi:predicted Zn-dependent peptidase
VLEQALATSVSTQNDARVDHGAFWVFAECALGAEPAKLEAAIDAEFARLRDELVPLKDSTAPSACSRRAKRTRARPSRIWPRKIGEFATDAHWRLALETIDKIKATDADFVRETARKLLTPERRVVGWCTPRNERPGKKGARRPNSRKTA